MASTVDSVFKFKRGTASRWAEVNPVLSAGEPGFVYDTHRLKIGDGVTPWNDLPYINEKMAVANYFNFNDFPNIGDPNVIYKASNELSLYQFNINTNTYEKLSSGVGIDNITIINGGNA